MRGLTSRAETLTPGPFPRSAGERGEIFRLPLKNKALELLFKPSQNGNAMANGNKYLWNTELSIDGRKMAITSVAITRSDLNPIRVVRIATGRRELGYGGAGPHGSLGIGMRSAHDLQVISCAGELRRDRFLIVRH